MGTTISSVRLAFHPDQLRLSDASACSLLSHPVPPESCTSSFPKQHLPCPSTAQKTLRPTSPSLSWDTIRTDYYNVQGWSQSVPPSALAPNPLPLRTHACSTAASPFSRPAVGFHNSEFSLTACTSTVCQDRVCNSARSWR